ncbi:MAG TPA: hypothetical protein VM261_04155 [Kofleriaceae bacterium]|nr:hypothetical protein [Kofleriaceae bacterium]
MIDGVDVGGGWLMFGLPPSEIAVHPTDGAASRATPGGSKLGVYEPRHARPPAAT